MRRISFIARGGFGIAFASALLAALMPLAGHALTLCICPDGAVSLDTECVPVSCCETEHAAVPPQALIEPEAANTACTEVPLLPESVSVDAAAAPGTARTHSGAPMVALAPQTDAIETHSTRTEAFRHPPPPRSDRRSVLSTVLRV